MFKISLLKSWKKNNNNKMRGFYVGDVYDGFLFLSRCIKYADVFSKGVLMTSKTIFVDWNLNVM